MATTALIAHDPDALEDMAQAGDETIAELERSIESLDAKIDELHTELNTLSLAQETRATRLIDERLKVAGLENTHNQAVAYAKLAHKTPNEQRAIREVSAAKKAQNAATKELAQVEHDTAQA